MKKGTKRVQIGWLMDDLIDDGDLDDFFAYQEKGDRPDVSVLSEFKGGETIHHSHGPVSRAIPVYIDWAPGMWGESGRSDDA